MWIFNIQKLGIKIYLGMIWKTNEKSAFYYSKLTVIIKKFNRHSKYTCIDCH